LLEEHTWPILQALPHEPQLNTSFCRLTQVPEQLESPVWHDNEHLPAEHAWPDLQAVPHAPQLLLSALRLAHSPLQLVSPL